MEKKYCILVALACLSAACSKEDESREIESAATGESAETEITLPGVAKLLSSLPIGPDQVGEVYDAVASSAGNGYDEEYMMKDLFNAPGCGVGSDNGTKALAESRYALPLRDMIRDYLSNQTKSDGGGGRTEQDVERYLKSLAEGDLQIYWPYSEDWDGAAMPIITFDPGYGIESNYGYRLSRGTDGSLKVDSVYVDENVARNSPVWVVNSNDDSAFVPLSLYSRLIEGGNAYEVENATEKSARAETHEGTKGKPRMLMLKSFTMLRNYDSIFGGASEFFVKCGSVNGFSASTEAELKLYSPSVTDMMIVVKRKYKGEPLSLDSIILTDFTNQLDQLAFLITEDDGGTTTSWKCSAIVKIESKSYGFDVDIPYKDKDDIVWRGQLSANFFQSADEVSGRFGDVIVNFALE